MQSYSFIFSDQPKHRIRRHLVFWACWWCFQTLLYSSSAGVNGISYFQRLPFSAIEAFLYLAAHSFFAYSLMYFVVPRFVLKGLYLKAAIAVLCLILLTGTISAFIGIYAVQFFREILLGDVINFPRHINEINFFLGLLGGLRGGITIGGIAAAIKLTKHWYAKEQRNHQLQQENITSQLQLLKAQVHPHFLFNTLNTIYANTQVTAPTASGMIMGLSGLLRYILYECKEPFVLLSRELSMIKEYMLLEQERYGNGLDMSIHLPDDTEEHAIAPLLLLPFVENCFKHGTSQVLEQPWISLQVTLDDGWMKMKLTNGKHASSTPSAEGIGLENVRKRLELLYPGKHSLQIVEEEDVFIVNLKVSLHKMGITTLQSTQTMAHA
jgi:sensor histidine kinase YesM